MPVQNNKNASAGYKSSGIYFSEQDNTIRTQSVGGFSAATIGLMEKGPAFQVMNSSTFQDRQLRLGGLNPKFPTSYYAKQYLEQASNYREVRMLGLEGYSDTNGFVIAYKVSGSTSATSTTPIKVGQNGVAAILKARKSTVTGRSGISSVNLSETSYIDPTTSINSSGATDYIFQLDIVYTDGTNESIKCSLRPDSKDYIVRKFGTDPMSPTTVNNLYSTLWVDYVFESVQWQPTINATNDYYLPNTTTSLSVLPLVTGNIQFNTASLLQSSVITNITVTPTNTTVTVSGNITNSASNGWLVNGNQIKIDSVGGNSTSSNINAIWKVSNISLVNGNTSFILIDINTSLPAIFDSSTIFTFTSLSKIYNYYTASWQNEVLDFANLGFTTPLTPWIVSDSDSNGQTKRLFRLISISDGESANTEIKVEINNIDPFANNGNGSFGLTIRAFTDREDSEKIVYETYSNLTMDSTNDNYILRRIGNGDDYSMNSKYIYIQMNEEEEIDDNELPYGFLGIPNTTDSKFPDMIWTNNYNLNTSISKQILGMANNKVNMFQSAKADKLALVSNRNGTLGKGFHLNPNNNVYFTTNSTDYVFADQNIYKTTNGGNVLPTEKKNRSKFVVPFYGGFDGWNVYSSRTFDDVNSADFNSLQQALVLLADPEDSDKDFSVLTTPDIFLDTHPNAVQEVTDMVTSRGDALYIPDFSYDSSADSLNAKSLLDSSQFQSNCLAVYFPWLQVNDIINKTNPWMPPSLLALGTIAYTATMEQVWQPPAGSIRTVTNNLVRTRRRLKLNDRETLVSSNINPITYFAGSGYEISGARTTQAYFSALSFIHNRLLLGYAKKVLNQVLRPLLFQQNNQVSADRFIAIVTPIFNRIQKLNGIEKFNVSVTSVSDDRTSLDGIIEIYPLYPIEKISVTFTLNDSGTIYSA